MAADKNTMEGEPSRATLFYFSSSHTVVDLCMFITENKSSFKPFVICWETSLICFYWWDRSREKELLFLSQIYLEKVENQLSQVKKFRSKAVRNLAQQQRKTEFWRITEKSVKTTPQHFFAVRFESSFFLFPVGNFMNFFLIIWLFIEKLLFL